MAAYSASSETVPTGDDRHARGLPNRPTWQFKIVGEIVNFDGLRRQLGCARADRLVEDVGERLGPALEAKRLGMPSRRHIEIAFDGFSPRELEQGIATFTRLCALPFDFEGEVDGVEMIFGGASAPIKCADDVVLAEEAEKALAEARAADHAVTHELGAPAPAETAKLTRELLVAIETDQLFLQYQPKLNVRKQTVTSAEGLIRWHHPERGVILPGDFIIVAEQSNLIAAMTLWTIRRAITDYALLLERGHDLRLFINISGQLLTDASFIRSACALIGNTDAKLGFEVTETSVIRDPQTAIANLQVFADFGIIIAIDDYGAGLSSLSYLKQLPARELKIDKLFVTQLTSSNRDPLIVRSTIDLAHALEMEVVAEGVETHPAMALLTVMGCDMIQGFLISRPIGLDALCVFLSEDRGDSGFARAQFAGFPARLAG